MLSNAPPPWAVGQMPHPRERVGRQMPGVCPGGVGGGGDGQVWNWSVHKAYFFIINTISFLIIVAFESASVYFSDSRENAEPGRRKIRNALSRCIDTKMLHSHWCQDNINLPASDVRYFIWSHEHTGPTNADVLPPPLPHPYLYMEQELLYRFVEPDIVDTTDEGGFLHRFFHCLSVD